MTQPRFKKRADTDALYLPGIGKLRDGQVVEGEQFARYCPQFLERTVEPVTKGKPAKKKAAPPPPPIVEPEPVEAVLFEEPPAPEPEAAPEPEPSTPKRRRRKKKEEDE